MALGGADGISTEIQGRTIHHYDGNAYEGLAKGNIGNYGALTRTEELVLTDGIVSEAYPSGSNPPDTNGAPNYLTSDSPSWPAEYPTDFENRIDGLDGRAGYTYEAGDGEYYVDSTRNRRDFQDGSVSTSLGVVTGREDPLGNETTIEWDSTYTMLPTKVTDPAGLVREASYDMRTLKPEKVTSPNDNRTKFAYTPLGLVSKKAVMGKASESKGDTLTDPGTSFTYDFDAFDTNSEPVSVRTTRRVHHVNNSYGPSDPGETIETVEYSDGYGRVVQTRVQAEELDFGDAGLGESSVGNASGSSPSTTPRVRVTGWKRYDNKGNVVEKWEPFFDTGWSFNDVSGSESGESIRMHYDGRGACVQDGAAGRRYGDRRVRCAGYDRVARSVEAGGLRADAVGAVHLRRERQRRADEYRRCDRE